MICPDQKVDQKSSINVNIIDNFNISSFFLLFEIIFNINMFLNNYQKPSNKFWSLDAIDIVVPLEAETCSKLLVS